MCQDIRLGTSFIADLLLVIRSMNYLSLEPDTSGICSLLDNPDMSQASPLQQALEDCRPPWNLCDMCVIPSCKQVLEVLG